MPRRSLISVQVYPVAWTPHCPGEGARNAPAQAQAWALRWGCGAAAV